LFTAHPVRAQDKQAPAPKVDVVPGQVRNRQTVVDYDGTQLRAVLGADEALEGTAVSALGDVLVGRLHDPTDEMLGATLQPVNDVLRAQLGIPAGRGLLVTFVRGDGASAQAGLRQNDILLALAERPLASPADLNKELKAAGESAVPLRILRAGKSMTLQVRPSYRVTIGPAAAQKTEYYIGVSLGTVEDALRAQLALPSGQGVVV